MPNHPLNHTCIETIPDLIRWDQEKEAVCDSDGVVSFYHLILNTRDSIRPQHQPAIHQEIEVLCESNVSISFFLRLL